MARFSKLLLTLAFCNVAFSACTTTESTGTISGPAEPHPGINWVRTAAEYEAVSLSTYGSAQDALQEKIDDRSWSALPYQANAAALPPAVIFDVDETVVSNVEFQASLVPPFHDSKLNDWNNANVAKPVAGVVDFAKQARAMGVTLFFITNRPCFPIDGQPGPCPQKATTFQDVSEIGVPVVIENVMLSGERPEWSKEKKIRRDFVAQNYRVIMLMGDDLGDFIPCSRKRPLDPCTEEGTIASRHAATLDHRQNWGNGWYILPNPMHGSWASVR